MLSDGQALRRPGSAAPQLTQVTCPTRSSRSNGSCIIALDLSPLFSSWRAVSLHQSPKYAFFSHGSCLIRLAKGELINH